MLGASSCIGGQLTDTKHKPSQVNNLLDNDDDFCKLPYQRLACMSSIRRQCCKRVSPLGQGDKRLQCMHVRYQVTTQ